MLITSSAGAALTGKTDGMGGMRSLEVVVDE